MEESSQIKSPALRVIFCNREVEGMYCPGIVLNQVSEDIYADWCHLRPLGIGVLTTEIDRVMGQKIR